MRLRCACDWGTGPELYLPRAEASVLEGLDWSVPQGAFALLVGGTGSGKSTLLSLLKPEIAPAGERTGELRVLGENVADMDVRASAERVGYVFRIPRTRSCAKPCGTRWRLAWKTWG